MCEWESRVSNLGLVLPSVENSGVFLVPTGHWQCLSIFPGQAKASLVRGAPLAVSTGMRMLYI